MARGVLRDGESCPNADKGVYKWHFFSYVDNTVYRASSQQITQKKKGGSPVFLELWEGLHVHGSAR